MVPQILNLLIFFLTSVFGVQCFLSHVHSTSSDGDLHYQTLIKNFGMKSNEHLNLLNSYS
jgi:hypothetical protein